jgi:prepilin-type N-terminal cleavage/methylation domain-containing protein
MEKRRSTFTGARKRAAFTLIELLVVVSIIALLASMLLPSLMKAKELTRETLCRSNLKSIGTGFVMYQRHDRWVFHAAGRLGAHSGP